MSVESFKKIVIKDKSTFSDSLNSNSRKGICDIPGGYVEVYEKNINDNSEKFMGRHNLVLYRGREWLLSRAFNVRNDLIAARENEFLYWVGFGNGGCTEADPLDPIPPTNSDMNLRSEIPISETNEEYADFRLTEGFYKKPYAEMRFLEDSANDGRYLISSLSIQLEVGDANGQIINEIGLYSSSSTIPGRLNTGPFHLYAKATFPSLVKAPDRYFLFIWYIYY
jgi:hypothetical protein